MSISSDLARTEALYRQFKGPIFGIYGLSDSGKTRLVSELVRGLKKRGYGVITAKHTAHSIYPEGKDSTRHLESGSEATLLFNDNGENILYIQGEEENPESALELLTKLPHDIILVEGMKEAGWPKILVGDMEARENTVFRYPANGVEEILDYLQKEIETARIFLSLPGFNCGECGHTCLELAMMISAGKKGRDGCAILARKEKNRVSIRVGGEEVHIGKKFIDDMLCNTITAMIETLKGAGKGDIEIRIRR